jgi:hypothetical protein
VKTDFRTERRDLYAPSAKEFNVVDVPELLFVMVDRHEGSERQSGLRPRR